jgi:hypothetical protein
LKHKFAQCKTERCLQALFRELLPALQQLRLGPVDVTPFEVGVGDRSVSYAMSRSASGPAQTIQIDVDRIYAVRDRAAWSSTSSTTGRIRTVRPRRSWSRRLYDRIGDKTA